MPRQRLQQLLADLHKELGSADSLDDETRSMLRRAAGELSDTAGEDSAGTGETRNQLQRAALEFESEHPRLSMIVGEIVDTLGKLGI